MLEYVERSKFLVACLVLVAIGKLGKETNAFVPTINHQRAANRAARSIGDPSQSTSLMMETIDCDVVIVGGGPAGCTCALYTSRGGHKTVIVDKNPSAGALAITSTIANYPGVDPTMSGETLLDNMRDQAVSYGTDYRRAQVFMVDFDESKEIKSVFTPDFTVNARTLVLATGALGRKPTFKGEAEFLGRGVSYCATCDGAFYQESPVAVIGDTQEAIEEAEFLTKFASVVHWIVPRQVDPANASARGLAAMDNVKVWPNTKLNVIEGDDAGVTGLEIKQRSKDDVERLDVEGAFIYSTGCKPITDYIGSKINLKDDGGVEVDSEMSTNVPGVYAIGDIRNTPDRKSVV